MNPTPEGARSVRMQLDEEIRDFDGGVWYAYCPFGGDEYVYLDRVPTGQEFEDMIDITTGSTEFVDTDGRPWFVKAPTGYYRIWFCGQRIVPKEYS